MWAGDRNLKGSLGLLLVVTNLRLNIYDQSVTSNGSSRSFKYLHLDRFHSQSYTFFSVIGIRPEHSFWPMVSDY